MSGSQHVFYISRETIKLPLSILKDSYYVTFILISKVFFMVGLTLFHLQAFIDI